MKYRIHQLRGLLCLLALSLPLAAQQSRPAQSTTADATQLKKHVKYLAADELEGRRPGTPGGDKAAAYLAEQFHQLKLGCASPDRKCRHQGKKHSGYLQEFPFIASVELAQRNNLNVTRSGNTSGVALHGEWSPIGFSSNGSAKAEMIFVGYGITAADLKHDDYANVDAKGKIAIALAGTPDGDNPHGQFGRYADERWKAIAAKDHGAAALLIIASAEKFADERLARLRYDQTAGEAGIPVAVVARQLAAQWFGLNDVAQLRVLEQASDKWPDAAKKLSAVTANLTVEVTRRAVPAYNVIGVIEGNDPKLKHEYIVIGAHYDHLGRGGHDGSVARNPNDIHYGADDNASGTAGLLEVARILTAQQRQLRRSIVLMAFSAEESGLIGSKAWTSNPLLPLADNVAMLNMDMIGRLKDNKLSLGGVGTSPEFRKLVENLNQGFTLQLSEDGFGPSDHSSFYAKQIPVLFFFTGTHEDYHKPSDTADKLNYDGQAKVVGLVIELALALDRNDARPTYVLARSSQPTGRSTGFRVYLGTVPNYADSNNGLLLDAVREDSPAAKAGLKAGDTIVKLGGREIKNVYDYTYALGEMKADQEYEAEVIRGSERLRLKVTPVRR